jgi:hypothetical protein
MIQKFSQDLSQLRCCSTVGDARLIFKVLQDLLIRKGRGGEYLVQGLTSLNPLL